MNNEITQNTIVPLMKCLKSVLLVVSRIFIVNNNERIKKATTAAILKDSIFLVFVFINV